MKFNLIKGAFLIVLISISLLSIKICDAKSSSLLTTADKHRHNGVFISNEPKKHKKTRPRTWIEKYFGDIESFKRIRQEAYLSSLQNYI